MLSWPTAASNFAFTVARTVVVSALLSSSADSSTTYNGISVFTYGATGVPRVVLQMVRRVPCSILLCRGSYSWRTPTTIVLRRVLAYSHHAGPETCLSHQRHLALQWLA